MSVCRPYRHQSLSTRWNRQVRCVILNIFKLFTVVKCNWEVDNYTFISLWNKKPISIPFFSLDSVSRYCLATMFQQLPRKCCWCLMVSKLKKSGMAASWCHGKWRYDRILIDALLLPHTRHTKVPVLHKSHPALKSARVDVDNNLWSDGAQLPVGPLRWSCRPQPAWGAVKGHATHCALSK